MQHIAPHLVPTFVIYADYPEIRNLGLTNKHFSSICRSCLIWPLINQKLETYVTNLIHRSVKEQSYSNWSNIPVINVSPSHIITLGYKYTYYDHDNHYRLVETIYPPTPMYVLDRFEKSGPLEKMIYFNEYTKHQLPKMAQKIETE